MLINSLNDIQDNSQPENNKRLMRPRSKSFDDDSSSKKREQSSGGSSESVSPDMVLDLMSKNSVRSKSLY